jgi:hypothetical protein
VFEQPLAVGPEVVDLLLAEGVHAPRGERHGRREHLGARLLEVRDARGEVSP